MLSRETTPQPNVSNGTRLSGLNQRQSNGEAPAGGCRPFTVKPRCAGKLSSPISVRRSSLNGPEVSISTCDARQVERAGPLPNLVPEHELEHAGEHDRDE